MEDTLSTGRGESNESLVKHGDSNPEPELSSGMKIDIKELYRDDPRQGWDDWTPEDVGVDPEETSEAKTYALVVRREKSSQGRASLALHSITVQSPLMRRILNETFVGYQGIST